MSEHSLKTLPKILFEMLDLPFEQTHISVRSSEHDRPLDDRHNVPSGVGRFFIRRKPVDDDCFVESPLEVACHFRETLTQPLSESRVGVAQGGTKSSDQASTFSVATSSYHFTDGVEATKDGFERLVRRALGKLVLNPIQRSNSIFHVVVDDCEAKIVFRFEVMEKGAARDTRGPLHVIKRRVVKTLDGKQTGRFAKDMVTRFDGAQLFGRSHKSLNSENRVLDLFRCYRSGSAGAISARLGMRHFETRAGR